MHSQWTFRGAMKTARCSLMHFFANAERYKGLRGERVNPIHIGEHYGNLLAVVTGNEAMLRADFTMIKCGLQRQLQNNNLDVNIGFMCKYGRHQSISICRVILEVLMRNGFTVRGPIHLHAGNWLPDQCWRCDRCDPNYMPKRQLYDIALEVWNSIAL